MKTIAYIIIVLLFCCCTYKQGEYGKLIIIEYQPVYENDNDYFPHDYFIENMYGMINPALSVNKEDNLLKIINRCNSGLSGHIVEFTVTKNFDIKNVLYDAWTDMINGSETKYVVEKVIFSVNTNPFENEQIVGYYTLQIREEFSSGEILKEDGVNDTVTFSVFNGKFKFYSEKEKEKGRDWIINQNEILFGIKDSLGVYYYPDESATFLGDNSIFEQFEIERSKTKKEKMSYVLLEMIVDEDGKIIPESMIIEGMKSDELLHRLKSCVPLLSNWQPAIYKGKSVKSKVNFPIPIKD